MLTLEEADMAKEAAMESALMATAHDDGLHTNDKSGSSKKKYSGGSNSGGRKNNGGRKNTGDGRGNSDSCGGNVVRRVDTLARLDSRHNHHNGSTLEGGLGPYVPTLIPLKGGLGLLP